MHLTMLWYGLPVRAARRPLSHLLPEYHRAHLPCSRRVDLCGGRLPVRLARHLIDDPLDAADGVGRGPQAASIDESQGADRAFIASDGLRQQRGRLRRSDGARPLVRADCH